MFRSPLALPLALALLPSPAAAQGLVDPILKNRSIPHDPRYRTGAIQRAAVADLNHDCIPDLAYVRDGEIFVATDPELWAWFVGSDLRGVTDITALRQPCHSGADLLFVVGPGGARLASWGANSFRSVALGDWDDVRRIRSQSQGNSSFLLAGIDEGDDVLRIGLWSPATMLTTTAIVPIPGVLEVILADWDNAGAVDVVVRTAGGLWAYDLLGCAIGYAAASTAATAGSITRARAGAVDQIAWLEWSDRLGDWQLRVLQDGAEFESIPLDLLPEIPSAATAVNLAAGDYDGDGDDDLLFYQTSSRYLAVFTHRGGLAGYSVEDYFLIDSGPLDPDVDRAPALFVDVNNDHFVEGGGVIEKRADIVVPIESAERFAFYVDLRPAILPPPPATTPGAPGLSGSGSSDYPAILCEEPVLTGQLHDTLQMTLEVPESFDFANTIQIVAWRHDDPHNSDQIVLERNCTFPRLPGSTHENVTIQLDHPYPPKV